MPAIISKHPFAREERLAAVAVRCIRHAERHDEDHARDTLARVGRFQGLWVCEDQSDAVAAAVVVVVVVAAVVVTVDADDILVVVAVVDGGHNHRHHTKDGPGFVSIE